MEINHQNIKTILAEVATSSQVNSISKVNDTRFNSTYKAFEKTNAQDQKNIFTSEKLESPPTIQEYNLRLQANSQIANLENSKKAFNDLKTNNIKFSKGVSKYRTGNTSLDEENISKEIDHDLEFYLVLNGNEDYSAFNRIKSHTDLLYEKIRDAYNPGYKKEPGTLVNLIY